MTATPARKPGRPRGNGKMRVVGGADESSAESVKKAAPSKSPGRPPSLKSIVGKGTELEMLHRLRDMTAEQLDAKPPAAAFASLTKQFLDHDAKIRELEARARREAREEDADPDDDWDPDSI